MPVASCIPFPFSAPCVDMLAMPFPFTTLDTLSGFVVVWLHLTPMRPCLGVTTWEVLP